MKEKKKVYKCEKCNKEVNFFDVECLNCGALFIGDAVDVKELKRLKTNVSKAVRALVAGFHKANKNELITPVLQAAMKGSISLNYLRNLKF